MKASPGQHLNGVSDPHSIGGSHVRSWKKGSEVEAEVPLSIFSAFVSAPTGAARLAKVIEAKERYDPRRDFYRELREAAIKTLVTGDLVHVRRTAERAHETRGDHYRTCAAGLERWMHKNDYQVIERPKSGRWESAHLVIIINPELLVRIRGSLFLIKLYLRQDTLTRDGINAFSFLVSTTQGKAATAEPRLLVLRASQLQNARPPKGIAHIVASEAAAFASMWKNSQVA